MQAHILNLMRDLQREQGVCCLFITYCITMVKHISNRVSVVRVGRSAEHGTGANFLQPPVDEYKRALLAAVPRL